MKIKTLIFCIIFYSSTAYSFDFNKSLSQFKVKARSLVAKYIDEETATKFFGPRPESVSLPKIPKVKKDAKASNNPDGVRRKEVSIKEEEKQKFDFLFLNELFAEIRKEKVTPDEINKWMNVLSQGSSREGIYRALVLDSVYASYENFGTASSEATLEFALKFLETYTGRKVQKSSLQSVNFFTVKRVIVERALDLFDTFPQDNEDLFDWYAVLSSDLAKTYPKTWNNLIRKDSSRMRHKNWAMSVPTQFLKSELIIKLHKVFNSLNG